MLGMVPTCFRIDDVVSSFGGGCAAWDNTAQLLKALFFHCFTGSTEGNQTASCVLIVIGGSGKNRAAFSIGLCHNYRFYFCFIFWVSSTAGSQWCWRQQWLRGQDNRSRCRGGRHSCGRGWGCKGRHASSDHKGAWDGMPPHKAADTVHRPGKATGARIEHTAMLQATESADGHRMRRPYLEWWLVQLWW